MYILPSLAVNSIILFVSGSVKLISYCPPYGFRKPSGSPSISTSTNPLGSIANDCCTLTLTPGLTMLVNTPVVKALGGVLIKTPAGQLRNGWQILKQLVQHCAILFQIEVACYFRKVTENEISKSIKCMALVWVLILPCIKAALPIYLGFLEVSD